MCNQPNIFKFATSELSQDAFICWLLSYVNHPQDEKLNKCAKEFIALLYNLKNDSVQINSGDIKEIRELKQQYCHTDVYFQALINGKIVSFIVEDKIYASHHSNQLEKYKKAIKEDKIEEDEVVCIYFKTGYIYPHDEEVRKYGYEILDYKKIHDFLQSYETDNLIFESYKQYIRDEFYIPYTTWIKKLLEEDKKTVIWDEEEKYLLSFPSVQCEFMRKLQEKCPGFLCRKGLEGMCKIGNGTNVTGTPWTQMWFVKLKDFYGEKVNETLLYRLDKKGKNDYYLSLRQYAKVEDNGNQKERKKTRLEQFREHFKDASSASPLSFGRVGNRGVYESEIAVLFFKDNSPMQVLSNLGSVHNNFIERLKTSGLVPSEP